MPTNAARRATAIALAATLLAGSCSSGDDDAAPTTPAPTPTDGSDRNAPASPSFETFVARCIELSDPGDSLDYFGVQGDEAIGVILTEEALAHAWTWPFYVATWGSIRHEGWFVVGVAGGAVELQAELDVLYPGAQVLAMQIDWTEHELRDLATEIADAYATIDPGISISRSISRGLVVVDVGEITEERVAPLEPFADSRRICIEGTVV